jgi:CBS-domain-containing membrane protein
VSFLRSDIWKSQSPLAQTIAAVLGAFIGINVVQLLMSGTLATVWTNITMAIAAAIGVALGMRVRRRRAEPSS